MKQLMMMVAIAVSSTTLSFAQEEETTKTYDDKVKEVCECFAKAKELKEQNSGSSKKKTMACLHEQHVMWESIKGEEEKKQFLMTTNSCMNGNSKQEEK